MPAHGYDAARYGPEVQVVDRLDTRHRRDTVMDIRQGDMPRRGLEEHIGALLYQAPGADQNQRPDEHRYERISHYPAGGQHDDAGNERAHRPQQIAQDVQVRAPLVERVFVPAVQYDDGHEIRHEADRRDPEQQGPVHQLRNVEPVP